MTSKRKEILAFLNKYQASHGFTPSYREIGEACNLKSPASVSYQLQHLAAEGKIRIYKGRNRAITLLEGRTE